MARLPLTPFPHAQPRAGDEEARSLTRARSEADASSANTRLTELGTKLTAQVDAAEQRIAGQRKQVMEGLEDMAHDVAAEVYAKLAGNAADKGALGAKIAVAAKGAR